MQLNLPKRKTLVVICSAFIAVALALETLHAGFPVSLAYQIVQVIDAWFHEFGHTIAGFLFGHFSVPLLMLTWNFNRSWTLQIFMMLLLAAACIWLWFNKREWSYTAIIVSIIIIALALTPYTGLIISYMGHGGALLFGGLFLYLALTFRQDNFWKQWWLAFMSWSMILRNVTLCYGLATSQLERALYVKNNVFGMDNDFTVISMATGFSTEQIAIFTLCLAGIIIITTVLLAIIPSRSS